MPITLKWNVINVLCKFANACEDATYSDSEVQMQGDKELFGRVITRKFCV